MPTGFRRKIGPGAGGRTRGLCGSEKVSALVVVFCRPRLQGTEKSSMSRPQYITFTEPTFIAAAKYDSILPRPICRQTSTQTIICFRAKAVCNASMLFFFSFFYRVLFGIDPSSENVFWETGPRIRYRQADGRVVTEYTSTGHLVRQLRRCGHGLGRSLRNKDIGRICQAPNHVPLLVTLGPGDR